VKEKYKQRNPETTKLIQVEENVKNKINVLQVITGAISSIKKIRELCSRNLSHQITPKNIALSHTMTFGHRWSTSMMVTP
jgi:hypothetical protein